MGDGGLGGRRTPRAALVRDPHARIPPAVGALNADVGLWFDGSAPPSDPEAELAGLVRCDGELGDRKFAALAAHTSQTSGLIALVGAERYRHWWSAEYFVDARTRLDHRPAA